MIILFIRTLFFICLTTTILNIYTSYLISHRENSELLKQYAGLFICMFIRIVVENLFLIQYLNWNITFILTELLLFPSILFTYINAMLNTGFRPKPFIMLLKWFFPIVHILIHALVILTDYTKLHILQEFLIYTGLILPIILTFNNTSKDKPIIRTLTKQLRLGLYFFIPLLLIEDVLDYFFESNHILVVNCFLSCITILNLISIFKLTKYLKNDNVGFSKESIPSSFIHLFTITDREREVIEKLLDGMANKEIAFNLGVTEKTIKNHLHNVYKKMGINSRLELVRTLSRFSNQGQ